jgi:hypothetical protein
VKKRDRHVRPKRQELLSRIEELEAIVQRTLGEVYVLKLRLKDAGVLAEETKNGDPHK